MILLTMDLKQSLAILSLAQQCCSPSTGANFAQYTNIFAVD